MVGGQIIRVSEVIDIAKNEVPTAYSVDKVVGELEERKEEREKQYKTASMEDGSYMLSKCFSEGARAYGNAIEIVKQEAKQYKGGWIPVSDRLPENNKVVLCWVVSKTIASGETFIIGSCDRGFWFLQTYEIGHHHFPVKDYEVVAWIPLPHPYQPNGE